MLLPGQYWYAVDRADPRLYAMYKRHYSAARNAPYRRPGNTNSVGPGSTLCLLTVEGDAAFIWLRNTTERYDHQTGVACTLFRNESPHLSSALIREAEQLAWVRWPGERLFTYVDAGKVRRKRDPGRCFLKAGWRRAGRSLRGLLLFEKRAEGVAA